MVVKYIPAKDLMNSVQSIVTISGRKLFICEGEEIMKNYMEKHVLFGFFDGKC